MWSPPALPPQAVAVLRAQAPPVQQQLDDRLVVEWRTQKVDPKSNRLFFSDGVKATYGPTTLWADELILDLDQKTGRARGNVRLLDPEGELRGEQLEFNWETRSGQASQAVVEIAGLRLSVSNIQISPNRWVLQQVKVSGSDRNGDAITFRARELDLKIGESGRASQPGLGLGSWVIAPLPVVRFSLDSKSRGLELPSLSWRRRVGFGLNWEITEPLTAQGIVGGRFNAFPNSRPSLSLVSALSGLPSDRIQTELTPRDDLDEPFRESYWDNVSVRRPEDEARDLHPERRTLGAGVGWNLSTRARPQDFNTVQRAWDFVGELGGPFSGGGGFLQIRYQRIREDSTTSAQQRLLARTSITSDLWSLSDRASVRLRLDAMGTTGYGQSFGWLRAQAGLLFEVNSELIWSWAVAGGVQSGRAPFRFDPLVALNTASSRLDWRLGNYHLNLLMRIDLDRRSVLSREASFSFVAGAFEPFIAWREFPSDIRIGFTFRGNEVFDRLKLRGASRSQSDPKKGKSR
ncbi:MAG TPA: hypothetical protein PLO61_09335 [Fimbriimonadaceae bacterium]|nr:hypothetical protein [Fimbriimonadaceae bacterium]HRJ33832.1 hypothetical protein [Fimbriimonadaceae bacterium]